MSSIASASSFFSLVFSPSNSFSRYAVLGLIQKPNDLLARKPRLSACPLPLQKTDSTNLPLALKSGGQVSRVLDEWAYRRGITLDFIPPRRPTENSFIEAFNGMSRDECLNAQFLSIGDARSNIDVWRFDYSLHRLHIPPGQLPPGEFLKRSGHMDREGAFFKL